MPPAQDRLDVNACGRADRSACRCRCSRRARAPARRSDHDPGSVAAICSPHCATPTTSSIRSSGSVASNSPSAVVWPSRDGLLRHDHANGAIGRGLAGEAIRGEEQHLARRGLGDQADVRHDHDRVGAQQVVDGFDDVDAGLLEVDRHAPHFGIAMVRQQLAPRRHDLIGIEQRHLREGVGVEHDTLGDFGLVAGGAPGDAIRLTGLRAREALHRLPLARASSRRAARSSVRSCSTLGFARAELMRIVEPVEEGERIASPCRRGNRGAECGGRSGRNSARPWS